MKRMKSTFFLFLAILALLAGCGSNIGSPKEATKMNTQESQSIHLTDNQAKDILNQLIPKAVSIYGLFNGIGFFKFDTKKTIPGENEFCLVTGVSGKPAIDAADVKAIADLKREVEEVFTKDTASNLFYSRYLETKDIGLPLYKDFEGRLYVNTNNGGHGWAEKFLIETAKLKGQKDNVAEIELDTTILDDPGDKLTIRIEFVNGKWLLASPLVL
ncbi:hypothetical protein [Paenibacillus azoreducens]|nr:hypothetical protein [Paenibacillus azoreducens]